MSSYEVKGYAFCPNGGTDMKKLLIPAALLLLLLLVACGEPDPTVLTVTYERGAGGRTTTETVLEGALLTPADPVRAGYDFAGWYVVERVETEAPDEDEWEDDLDADDDPAETAPPRRWDPANDRVTADLTLRAHWTPRVDTVYLDPNGAECEVETVYFTYGGFAEFPKIEREGYYLDGWYCAGRRYVRGQQWWGNPAYGPEIRFKAKWTTFPPGMTVHFGTYEQDNDLENGPEPIEWIVLDYRDGQYLLFASYILEGKPIHDEYGAGARAWQTCSLRTWLNGEFYTTAFSEAERTHIVLTELADTATQDHVFLLSYEEIVEYTFEADYTVGRSTAYAKANGLEINNGEETNPLFSWWYVRTPRNVESTYDLRTQAFSSTNGSLYGVRPALWIDEAALDDSTGS